MTSDLTLDTQIAIELCIISTEIEEPGGSELWPHGERFTFSAKEMELSDEMRALFHDSPAKEFIYDIRRPGFKEGEFDIELTAAMLNSRVIHKKMEDSLGLLRWSKMEGRLLDVIIDPRMPEYHQKITFAHEVAHYFIIWLKVNGIIEQRPQWPDEEAFCDYFAHCMVDGFEEMPNPDQLTIFDHPA